MSIQNQKIENILNLALEVTPSERSRSVNLETGYLPAQNSWKVIVKYSGRLLDLNQQFPDVQIAILSNQYAILQIPENLIDPVSNTPYITFMEKPKRLFFATFAARQASCITSVQESSPSRSLISGIPGLQSGLSGKDILVGVIDSGIDYAHPDFRNPDGTTRILSLWDQTIASTADTSDEIYRQGSFYSSQTINQALMSETEAGRLAVCPSRDLSGHGTHVAGIAAGNGRASDGVYRGVAYESDLVIVKLGVSDPGGFPSTVELMEAVDYCVRFAESMQKPLALNLSFGNNYGSHSGTSLLETFLNDITGIGRVSICVGTGNEGNSAGHTGGILTTVQSAPSSLVLRDITGPSSVWNLCSVTMKLLSVCSCGKIIPTGLLFRSQIHLVHVPLPLTQSQARADTGLEAVICSFSMGNLLHTAVIRKSILIFLQWTVTFLPASGQSR